MGNNSCPCLQANSKSSNHYALLEEKNGTIISENSDKDNIKTNCINGVNSFGPPTLGSNVMNGNSPNFKNFDEDAAEQIKQSPNATNIEILIKNEGELDEKDAMVRKKVKFEDFDIVKVYSCFSFFI